MIVVDTSVVSELIRPSPSPQVRDWIIRAGARRALHQSRHLPDHGAALATRNAKDFEETGIDVIDPWQQSPPANHTTPPTT